MYLVCRLLLEKKKLDQLITGAPGFRDLLICGKLFEITHVRRTTTLERWRPDYDLLVVEGPPKGQVASFLASSASFSELTRATEIYPLSLHDALPICRNLAGTHVFKQPIKNEERNSVSLKEFS